eukprot:jgi/Psemu1/309614/fgenesh1_kg.534_\
MSNRRPVVAASVAVAIAISIAISIAVAIDNASRSVVHAFAPLDSSVVAARRSQRRRSTSTPRIARFVAKDVISKIDAGCGDDEGKASGKASGKANANDKANDNDNDNDNVPKNPDTTDSMIIVVGNEDEISLTSIDLLRDHQHIPLIDGDHGMQYLDPLRAELPTHHERKRSSNANATATATATATL